MTVRQADAPIIDEEFRSALFKAITKRSDELVSPLTESAWRRINLCQHLFTAYRMHRTARIEEKPEKPMRHTAQIHALHIHRIAGGTPRPRFARVGALIASTLFGLSACAGGALPDDPFDGAGDVLGMVPINHTDRYAVNIFVDKYWAGDVSSQSGGGKASCCFPGLKDWSKPATVRWTWGWEEDPETKTVTQPDESHTVIVHFPAGGPHRDREMSKDDAYLCVILRDLDKVDLAFSPSAFACADK